MLKNSQKCNFWKEHQKMRWMPKFDKLSRKLCPNENFGSLTSIFLYNFTQNLRNIEFSQATVLSFRTIFFGTVWRNLSKIFGTDFPQSPKNCQKWPKMSYFRINERFSRKRAKISKKRPCYISNIFYPQLHAKFRKNPWSGF